MIVTWNMPRSHWLIHIAQRILCSVKLISLRGRGRISWAPKTSSMQAANSCLPTSPVATRTVPQQRRLDTVEEVEKSLYFVICEGKSSLQTVVDDWNKSYQKNKDAALLSVMQFFINSSGCKGKITEFNEDISEYPLIMTGYTWKKFHNNFCNFVKMLTKQFYRDQYFMDYIIMSLTGLSDSEVRAFRHTATLATMKMITELMKLVETVAPNLEQIWTMYKGTLTNENRNDKEASEMKNKLKSVVYYLTGHMKTMFHLIFEKRHTDISPEIRTICMVELGIWMRFHHKFFNVPYLKYIGLALYDKVGTVRGKCLEALQYASEEVKKLERLTTHFKDLKDRVIEMTHDTDNEVAIRALDFLINNHAFLTNEDFKKIYKLVYSSCRAVAHTAGKFLNERLLVPCEEPTGVKRKLGKKHSPCPNKTLIRHLVQFFIESEVHKHGAYLVDSLIHSNEMMKDWESMTELLLEKPGPNEALNDKQETSLIEIMVCCIRQAATGKPPVGRDPVKKILTTKMFKKKMEEVQNDRKRLTNHFIKKLPQLLEKYHTDSEKLANLLAILEYLKLDIFNTQTQEGFLDSLLEKIKFIIKESHNNDVLDTLAMLCSRDSVIPSFWSKASLPVVGMIVEEHEEAMGHWRSLIERDLIPNENETFNVVQSLKKVSSFYKYHNLGCWKIQYFNLQDIIEEKKGSKSLPEEAIRYCIAACFFSIMWDLRHLEDVTEGKNDATELVNSLRVKLHHFMDTMKDKLLNGSCQQYKEEAYITVCDLLIVFCDKLGSNLALVPLIYKIDADLLAMLTDFIETYVFVMEDTQEQDELSKQEELYKKRNFLASFSKLVVNNIVPMEAAANLFKHYDKHYKNYGDIIKATLDKAYKINKITCAKTIVLSLRVIFEGLPMDGILINRHSEEFVNLKELAKRFALWFGLNAVQNSEAIKALHRDGILFSVDAPQNLSFLEILTEFTPELLKQDKSAEQYRETVDTLPIEADGSFLLSKLELYFIVEYFLFDNVLLNLLNRKIATGMPSSHREDLQPLLMYRASLLHGEIDLPLLTGLHISSKKGVSVEKTTSHDDSQLVAAAMMEVDNMCNYSQEAQGQNPELEESMHVCPSDVLTHGLPPQKKD